VGGGETPKHAVSGHQCSGSSTSRRASLHGLAASNNRLSSNGSPHSQHMTHRRGTLLIRVNQACRNNSLVKVTTRTATNGSSSLEAPTPPPQQTTTTQAAPTAITPMLRRRSHHSTGRDQLMRTELSWRVWCLPVRQRRRIRCLRHHSKVIKDLNDE